MKLKTKIQICFLGLVLIPTIMICLLAGTGIFRIKSIYNEYYSGNPGDNLYNSMDAFNHFNRRIEGELEAVAASNPEKLSDKQFLDDFSAKIRSNACYLVVMADKEMIYYPEGLKYSDEEICEQLDNIYDMGNEINGGIYLGGDFQLLVNAVDFMTPEIEEGRVYIIISVNQLFPRFKGIVVIGIVGLGIVLLVSSTIMTVWIYRSIITPIKKLKIATNNIAEGNLDFTIENDRHDEIGELCDDFEKMRKRLKDSTEEKLENDRQSKELISNISHDLKTPLTAIKGYCEGIQDGIADTPEKMDRYIKTIYNKSLDMTKLIDELTIYSKIDTNKIPYNFNKINVKDYFDDCVSEIRLELEAKKIELGYFNYTGGETTVIADAEQLKRVINNIVSNSVKYMVPGRKGIINIRIKDAEDFVQVEIEDNGKGIAQKDIQYIFDRFFRTDSSRNSSQGGSGIGLSIVKKIISDHGGQIWATSKEGTGTVMYFVLRKYVE